MPNTPLRTLLIGNVSFAVDTAMADRTGEAAIPENARFVLWPVAAKNSVVVVAVWSYIPETSVDDDEAVSLSKELLDEYSYRGLDTVTPQVI